MPYGVLQLEQVRRLAREFDILHFHTAYLHFPLVRDFAPRTVTTIHGRLDLPDCHPLFDEYDDMPLVSISDHQRASLSARWMGTIYHGLPRQLYTYRPDGADGYLAFLGRICPEKRPDRAIEIAKRLGIELKIAAKVDKVDQAYFDDVIRPLLNDPHVDFIGEINEREKQDFLGGARALLFPIDWPEPFGLVMIEAMACGTPVVAWHAGSVPEVIDPGVNGFIVETIDEAVAAIEKLEALDRRVVRDSFEERFSVERMTKEYVSLYQSLVKRAPWTLRAA
jgi:glycosyltransferase involved in cell wall biosynthesis